MTTYLVKAAFETTFTLCAVIPFFVNNTEGDVFIWWSSDETNEASVLSPSRRKGFASLATVLTLDAKGWCFGCINKVGIEDVELVTLNDLGWKVLMVIMSLVVLVPLVAHLNSVEVAWFSRTIRVGPFWLSGRDILLSVECFFVVVEAPRSLSVIQCTCDPRRIVSLWFRRQGEIGTGCFGAVATRNVAELENPTSILNLYLNQLDN